MRRRPLDVVRILGAACTIAAPLIPSVAETVTAPDAVGVVGDAIPSPLTDAAPDAARGRAVVLDRASGNCLICHKVPVPSEPFQGNLGPDLSGVGGRLSSGQIRLRLVDQSRLNPMTLMPPYYRSSGLTRVDTRYAGKPVLSANEIEDVVAYLSSLQKMAHE